MASSSKRGCNSETNDTGDGAGSCSGGSFSRDNSGETVSGSDSTTDHQQHQHSHQQYTSTSRQHQQHQQYSQRSASEHSGASHQTRNRPGSSSGERGGVVDDFEGDDDVIDEGDASCSEEKAHSCHSQRWRKAPESCSSYSSLNNDEDCDGDESLHSQDGEGSSQAFDLPSQFAGRSGGGGPGGYNYPRKYSLTVPGEPRHMRLLHRRESGSRSPLNSSCGGLSPSELSTPSPSCSNSM